MNVPVTYKLIMYRQTPTSPDPDGTIIWTGTRIKEARGQQKQIFNSTLETIIAHDMFGMHDYLLDAENFRIILYDIDYQVISDIQYIIVESYESIGAL